jgi:hypothetical protein
MTSAKAKDTAREKIGFESIHQSIHQSFTHVEGSDLNFQFAPFLRRTTPAGLFHFGTGCPTPPRIQTTLSLAGKSNELSNSNRQNKVA